MNKKKVLVTGGAGFIGSNYVDYILENFDDEVVTTTCVTHSGEIRHKPTKEKDLSEI